MEPRKRLPRTFPLRLRGDHARLSIFVPVGHYVLGGAILLLLPVVMLAVGIPLVLRGDDPLLRDQWWGARALYAAFVAALAIAGAVRLAFARRWARRGSVTLDRVTQTIRRGDAAAGIDLKLAAAVRLRNRRRGGLWALDLVRIDGTLLTVIHHRLASGHGEAMQAIAEAVGEWLRNPAAEVPPELGT